MPRDKVKRFRQGKRRRMTKFAMDELSAVDFPAQEGATAVLIKRRGEPDYDPDNPDPEKRGRREDVRKQLPPDREAGNWIVVITSEDNQHSHGVTVYGNQAGGFTSYSRSANADHEHEHAWTVTDQGMIRIGSNDGHTHMLDRDSMRQALQTLAMETRSSDEDGESTDDPGVPRMERSEVIMMMRKFRFELNEEGDTVVDLLKSEEDHMSKQNDLTPKQVEDLQKQLELATKMAEMNDAQRAHMTTLDEAGQTAFLGKSKEARQEEVDVELAKAADANPVIYTDVEGNEYRKSDDHRVVAAVQRADEATKRAIQADAVNKQAEFEKRADVELAGLPGDVKTRAEILKSLESISDDTMRKGALEAITAANTAASQAHRLLGHGAAGQSNSGVFKSADQELDRLAKSLQSENPEMNFEDAYDHVTRANPALTEEALTGDAA